MKCWSNPLSRGLAALTVAITLGLSAGIGGYAKADQPANKAVAPPFQGTALGPDGRRVAGATVVAVGDVGHGERLMTTTDAEGRFSFAALPAGKTAFPGVYLYVVRDGFGPLILIVADPAKPSPAEFKLPAAGAFQGTVTNSAGVLIAGAEVQVGYVHRSKSQTGGSGASWGYQIPAAIRGTPAEPYFFAVTDQAGGFRFPALPADSELIFRVTAKGYAELDTGAGSPKEAQFVVKANAAPAELVLRPEAVIRGRVTSKVAGISPGVAVVQLNGTNTLHGFHRSVKPGTDGGYEANGLPDGPISVSLELPSDAAATSVGALETTRAGQTNDLDLTIISGVEVTGQVVVRDTNEPVPGAWIATSGLVSPTGFHFGGKPTDAKGRFTLRLPPGTITVMVWRAPGEFREINGRRQTIVVPADATRFEMPEPFVLGKLGAAAAAGGAGTKESTGPKPIAAEQAAAAIIRQLGGWYTLDGDGHVVEINMDYHEEGGKRTDNWLIDSDGALRAARQFPKLKKLYLTQRQATDEGLAALAGLAELEVLMIWDAAVVSDAGVAHLAGLPKLQNIHMSNGAIGDGALAVFAKLPSLKTLSLQGNNFSDAGLKHLAGMKQLQSLWIGMNKQVITDAGAQHLAGLTGLEQLDLQQSQLTATGIAALKNLTQLKSLYVQGVSGAAGINDTAIEPLLGMNRLQTLSLGNTLLTPMGTRLLMELPSLKDLSLTSPLIEAATVDDLKKQRPGLKLRITKPGD